MKNSFLRVLALLAFIFVPFTFFAQSYETPFWDSSLPAQVRAEDLCRRLMLEEKVGLLEHESKPVSRLGIPEFNWWSEALHGVGRNGQATVFPIPMALAATWDDALVHQCFDMVSTEARAKNNIARHEGHSKIYEGVSFWTPNINIFRDPRWGRGQETYGEDPYLTSRMGLAVVRGLQGPRYEKYKKLLACAKHFAVHSGPEWSRHSMNIDSLPLRDLWETYLPAFKTLVQNGHVAQVMCAYQRLDGEPCCGNTRLLQQILRDEWKFDGVVVSDCWAVDDFWRPGRHGFSDSKTAAISHALRSGTDVECGVSFRSLVEAVKEGKVKEEDIDRSLVRLLRARFEVGDFDPEWEVEWKRIGPEVIQCRAHHLMALEAARRSIVLLQNRGGILPLKGNERILVLGQNAADAEMQWGNYNGTPSHTVTVLEGLQQKFKNVQFVDNFPLVLEDSVSMEPFLQRADSVARLASDVIVFVGGISPRLEGEEMKVTYPGFKGGDRTDIELPTVQREVLRRLHAAGKKVIFVNCSGSAIALEPETQSCDAILQAWYGGHAAGTALAEILLGQANPSAKLPVTFYRSTAQLPDYEDYKMAGRTYRYMREQPLWPFGFGLSYSSFRISNLRFKDDVLSVKVENTSGRDGAEVVQVYVRRIDDSNGPIRTLRAFRRIDVAARENVQINIPLGDKAFEWWNPATNTVCNYPGEYEIQVGNSSRSSDLQTIRVTRH